jgi:hypothetical protein
LSYQELSLVLSGLFMSSVTDSIRLALRQALAQLLGIDLASVGEPVFTSVTAAAADQHRSLGTGSAVEATTLIVASGSFLSTKADPSPSSAVASTVAGNTAALVSSFQSYAVALSPANQAVVNATSVKSVAVVDRTPTRQPSCAPSLQPSLPSLVASLNTPSSAPGGSSTALAAGVALAALALACSVVWALRRRWGPSKTHQHDADSEAGGEEDDEEESVCTLPPPTLGPSDDCTDDEEEEEESDGESVRVVRRRGRRSVVRLHPFLPPPPPTPFSNPLSVQAVLSTPPPLPPEPEARLSPYSMHLNKN